MVESGGFERHDSRLGLLTAYLGSLHGKKRGKSTDVGFGMLRRNMYVFSHR